MGIEIERKFLVTGTGFLAGLAGRQMVQGYVAKNDRATVRVRIAGAQAWLTLKGKTSGISRLEHEYPIPVADAEEMLRELCDEPLIRKVRYRVPHAGHVWDVDVFEGDNAGLVVAEVELDSEDEAFDLPEWAGEDISHDPRYFNSALALRPYATWER